MHILESQIKEQVPGRFNSEKLTLLLQKYDFSVYGYWRYVSETYPSKYTSEIISPATAEKFSFLTKKEERSLPQHLYNAGMIHQRLTACGIDSNAILEQLANMVEHHVLWLLFYGCGIPSLSKQYEEEGKEYARRFPSAIEKLPEPFCNIIKEDESDSTGPT